MITFIVIGRNEEWRLEKCLSTLRSIANKELAIPFEILYVDSQSKDNSIEISKKYADRVFLITGICNAAIGRNVGANEAKGDVLFFLDGDMELHEGVLSLFSNKEKLTYPFISGVEYEYLYDNKWNLKEKRIRRKFVQGVNRYEKTTGGLFVIEKWLWEKVGGIDNRFLCREDYDLGFRLSKLGYPLLRMGQVWVTHYTRFYGVREDQFSSSKYTALLLRKHFFCASVQKSLLMNNYSCYCLAICLLSVLYFYKLMGLLIFIPYIIIVSYRSMRSKIRGSADVDFIIIFKKRIMKDLYFLFSFFTFFPNHPHVSYNEV